MKSPGRAEEAVSMIRYRRMSAARARTLRFFWLWLGLLCAVLLAGCKDKIDLQTKLSDGEANEVVAALEDEGIAAHKRGSKDGVAVSIAEADLPRATSVLNARGLPRQRQARLGEVFRKEGLVSSPMEERARYIYALSQELEATLSQIDGVIVARVHVVLPEKPAPGEPMSPPTTAVFIKHQASLDPDVIAPRIRQLVARSIPGLGAQGSDKVSVVFVEGAEAKKAVEVADNDDVSRAVGIAVIALGLCGFAATMLRGKPLARRFSFKLGGKPKSERVSAVSGQGETKKSADNAAPAAVQL